MSKPPIVQEYRAAVKRQIASATALVRLGLTDDEAADLVSIEDENPITEWTAAMANVKARAEARLRKKLEESAAKERVGAPGHNPLTPGLASLVVTPSPDTVLANTAPPAPPRPRSENPLKAAKEALADAMLALRQQPWRQNQGPGGTRTVIPDNVRMLILDAVAKGAEASKIGAVLGISNSAVYNIKFEAGYAPSKQAKYRRQDLKGDLVEQAQAQVAQARAEQAAPAREKGDVNGVDAPPRMPDWAVS